MKTINTTKQQQWRRHVAGIAAVAMAATVLLAAPPATANQDTGNGGSTTRAFPADVDEVITARKIALAQDHVDRAWLYR